MFGVITSSKIKISVIIRRGDRTAFMKITYRDHIPGVVIALSLTTSGLSLHISGTTAHGCLRTRRAQRATRVTARPARLQASMNASNTFPEMCLAALYSSTSSSGNASTADSPSSDNKEQESSPPNSSSTSTWRVFTLLNGLRSSRHLVWLGIIVLTHDLWHH